MQHFAPSWKVDINDYEKKVKQTRKTKILDILIVYLFFFILFFSSEIEYSKNKDRIKQEQQ